MKVLLINGSPNQYGCTNEALTIIKEELTRLNCESEIIWLGVDPINDFVPGNVKAEPCKGDELIKVVGEKLINSDGIILGSPTYFAHPTGRILSFMDNLSRQYGSKLSHKPGAAIMSARRAGQVASMDILNKHFSINNMPIVSTTYWNMVFGNTPEEVRKDEEGVHTMVNLARNMVWLISSIKAGESAGIKVPETPKCKTNFHR